VNPAHCIGHGACKTACPHSAIELVFGTEKRGVDIPLVKPNFETSVPGIFIAGELGGMGLIRKAVEQGRQAIESIAKLKGGKQPYDVVIVGAGPAGISASLGAMEKKLRFVTVEQEVAFGGTVYHYPRNKVVMTAPVQLPIIGRMKFGEVSKEKLLEFWQGVLKQTGLKINFFERMESIKPMAGGFVVKTSKQEYRTRTVLLTIGRRGTPRKLGVPGEEQAKVVYRLIDPEQYRKQHVLVVGGGDSALEAALACAGEPGTSVALSYRSEAFARVKEKNRQRLAEAQKGGRVQVLLKSNVKQIEIGKVILDQDGKRIELRNDAVIVSAGGVLPTPFLKEIGILVETKYGTA
jgi:thioredoxin reductase